MSACALQRTDAKTKAFSLEFFLIPPPSTVRDANACPLLGPSFKRYVSTLDTTYSTTEAKLKTNVENDVSGVNLTPLSRDNGEFHYSIRSHLAFLVIILLAIGEYYYFPASILFPE
ncbi:hypothetical protein C8F04DRAFT_1181853 [Mycena alexandri]|uniref:Uncharacterized protein n=1 Tax=Mycena alexandri TaxID=1745969 RepID=A0AAD6T0U3_9AGAR|nr:hypothetical protein C8F04DRAFT_1181853 [Mycena alexandri]